jgi:hypothetical protein
VVQGLQKVVTVARAPDARLTRRFSCSVFIVWLLWLCGADALPLCFPPSLPCLDVRGEERRSASFSPSPPSLTQLAGGPTAPNLLLPAWLRPSPPPPMAQQQQLHPLLSPRPCSFLQPPAVSSARKGQCEAKAASFSF